MQPVDLFICSAQDWANDLTSKLVKATSLERFLITSLTRLFSESNVAHGAHDLDRAWHIQYQMCGLIWSCFHKLLQRGESSQVERVNNLSFMLENRRRSLSSIERPSFNIFVHPADGISPRVPWDNAHSEIGQIQYWLTGKHRKPRITLFQFPFSLFLSILNLFHSPLSLGFHCLLCYI